MLKFDHGEGYLHDLTRPIAVGARVNVHVIQASQEPEPDFEAMRRLVAGTQQREPATGDERA
jgi:hypothetical protein